VYWNACKRLTQGASAAEKAALFSSSAARFYRLDLAMPDGSPHDLIPLVNRW
jgi:hypothetical protein